MSPKNDKISQIIADILRGKVYETELGNYAAGTRSRISITQSPDKLQFLATETEQDAYNADEWTKTQHLSSVDELTSFLNNILNH